MSLEQLRALGREYDAAHPGEWERRIGLRKPDDLAILVYTSGTTGKPKGAMISHANVVLTCRPTRTRFRRTSTTSAWLSCRCATSPSGWAASTTRSTPARC